MARPSLHRKLVTVVVAAVLSAWTVSTAVTVWQQASSYVAARKQALLATAQIFGAAVGPATATRDVREALLALRAIGRIPDFRYVEIRTVDGRVLTTLGTATRLASDPSLDRDLSVIDLLTSGTVEVGVPVLNGGSVVGRLTLIAGVADLWPRLLAAVIFTALGGGLALVVGLLVAWRFQRAITEPLQALVQATIRVRKDHDYGIEVPDAGDREIGQLVDGFNRMLRDVRDRDARLEAHRRNLEQEVADRTRDLEEARDQAEQASRAKSEFLATMSHEIRTPMNGIMTMAELLTSGVLPVRQRRFAEIIAKSGQTLLAILNDILDFSKIEAGKIELESRPLDLNELAENVVSLFAERAAGKSIDLAAVVDPGTPRSIVGDPIRLGQIIGNLVNNALKFTERGFVQLTIAPAVGKPCAVEIRVTDSGIGIPRDKLAAIFEAFSQADQSTTRQFGGTGLGLAICKRLVETMGGEISVESEPGKGSTFVVVVPAGDQQKREWPRLGLASGESRFCALDVAGEATASALGCYLAAAGYAVIRARGTTGECARASLICVDADRLSALESAPERARPIVVAVCRQGDVSADEVVCSGKADAVVSRPVLRSEIENLLEHVAAGKPFVQPIDPPAGTARGSMRFRPFRALLADDNPINREVASEALSQLGAAVETVENGLQAVEAVAAARYDIVFMDGSMPELDGFEAARRIRAAQARLGHSRTVIVALTAHVVGTAADAWRDAGMDDVVHKPFTLGKLAQTIAKLLPHLAGADGTSERSPQPAEPAASHGQSSRPHPGDTAELLDPDVLAQLRRLQSNGKAEFVHKILGLYAEHAPAAVERLRQSAASRRADECSKAAHALKSMSLNIGAKRMAELTLAIETAAKTQHQVPSDLVIEELRRALAMTLQGLATWGGSAAGEGASPFGAPAVAQASTELERALPLALRRNELFLLYQPIVDRTGTRTCGVEALVRWKRDGGEPVLPQDFIPLAERTGMIHDLGDWVLRRACEDAAAWPSLTLAVNASPLQFARADLVDRFSRILLATQFEGRRLEVEITESALLEAEGAVLEAIECLTAWGVTFALDDFGTGFSSLNYLRRFPFAKIKIDRSFIANIDTAVDATIVHAIASIGRSLGLKLVGEGVENAEQQRFLSAAGIHYMQGHRFGHPATCDAISERLRLEQEPTADLARGGR